MMFAGWVNRHQLDVIDYLQEENRVLKKRLDGRGIHFTDAERRRLARKAYALGRKVLSELQTLVTPDTLRAGAAPGHEGNRGSHSAYRGGKSLVGIHTDPRRTHWECLTATDFLSVEVHTIRGLVTYYILFFIDIASPLSPHCRRHTPPRQSMDGTGRA
jgi:hypothetical protein